MNHALERLLKTAWRAPAGAAALIVAGACGPSSPQDAPAAQPCAELHVERFKEIVVVDDAVLDAPQARNATGGPWSFRHAIENMAPAGADPSDFVLEWLRSWVEVPMVNGYAVERQGESRVAGMQREIVCPWLKRSPSNECDDLCGKCAAKKLDLALAPFRLIAIVNRMDLRDEVEGEPAGEGRLVFATVKGAGDDAAAEVTNMVLIFEYRLPETRSLVEWAQAWHGLGRFAAFDDDYRAALEGVTNGFTKRDVNPTGINGSALAQVRTNEQLLHWRWQLREFGLGLGGELQPRPLRNTPPEELNNSPVLGDFLVANGPDVRANKFEMPIGIRGASTTVGEKPWSAPEVDEETLKAFARNTCNGCHTTEEPTIDTRFHVSPFKRGSEKLSPMILTDREGRPSDLTLRTAALQRALCAP